MKIVVTSDTHIKTIAKKPLPEKLREACKQADLICTCKRGVGKYGC